METIFKMIKTNRAEELLRVLSIIDNYINRFTFDLLNRTCGGWMK